MAIETIDWDRMPPAHCRGGAVAVGNFDGVHRGHAALVRELCAQARACNGPAVVVTFDPHPLQFLRPAQFQPVLTTAAGRAALIISNGADHVIVMRITATMLELSAGAFFQSVIKGRLAARAMTEGPNFAFGHNREGNVDTLARLCREADLGFVVVPPMKWKETTVSSSRVRTALLSGNVREAADLLARPYRLSGTVTTGQGRGQALGFPTANLERIETLIPGDGVYAVSVRRDGQCWPGASNVGPNPTFGEQVRKVEVHLIGFDGPLVGEELEVDFIERLRDTRPFAGVPQLVEQLRLDVERARNLVGPPVKGHES
jgi:riboflavin kinase / FMN adenylyltransferase